MNCERAQAGLSARMDGERLPARLGGAVDAHAASCARCRTFAARAGRIRAALRVREAEPVPDLVEPIMTLVVEGSRREESRGRAEPTERRRSMLRAARARRPSPALAATIAGLVAGSLVVGGPWQRPSTRPIAAAAVVSGVQGVAPSLDAYAASFAITERGLSPEVAVRRMEMDLAFRAPQRFRLDVRDLTTYPSPWWTPTNLTYISDGSATYRSGPTGCPADLPAGGCPPTRTTLTRTSAYSAAAPAPADLILPLTTLSSARGVRVLGTGRVAGRDAVEVELTFSRGRELLPFLDLGGDWRPFFDDDRIDLWLDRDRWFPLRITVYPSNEPARRAWALRFGRAEDPPGVPILDVRLTTLDLEPPGPARFALPGWSPPATVPLAAFPEKVGYLPVTLTSPGHLTLSSAMTPPAGDPQAPRSLLLYTDGLAYLRIGERTDWSGGTLFGPVEATAQRVGLADGGVAYYEPAGEGLGRRLAIHSSGTDLFLESNLPRDRLLALAATLPVRGEPLPQGWRRLSGPGISITRVPPADALAMAPAPIELPASLPSGYVVASARVESSDLGRPGGTMSVTLVFRQRETDSAGPPIELHVEGADALPPASSAEQLLVDLDGATARWTPGRDQLEWVSGGTYLSLQGSLDLEAMLNLAASIRVGSTGSAGSAGSSP